MPKVFSRIILLLPLFLSTGNSDAQQLHTSNGSDARLGLKDDNGIWVVNPVYSNIEPLYYDYPQIKYWILETTDHKFGLTDSTGKKIFDPKYQSVIARSDFSSQNIFHQPFKPFCEKDSIIFERACGYRKMSNGEYYYGTDNIYWGLADSTGKMLTPPIYRELASDSAYRGLIYVIYLDNSRYRYGYLDEKGKEVVKPEWTSVSVPGEKGIWVSDESRNGFLYWNGKFVEKNIYCAASSRSYFDDQLQYATESVLIGTRAGKIGLMNDEGDILIQPQFNSIGGFTPSNLTIFSLNGKYGIVNTKGKILLSDFDTIEPFHFYPDQDYPDEEYYNNNADPSFRTNVLMVKNGKYGVFNDSNGTVVKCIYDHAGWQDAEHTIFWGEQHGKIFFVRMNGKKSKPQLPGDALKETIQDYQEAGHFPLRVQGKDIMYRIDAAGNILMQWNFSFGEQLEYSSLHLVNANGKSGAFDDVLDTLMIPAVYQQLGYYTNSDYSSTGILYVQTFSGHFGAYDANGKMILDTVYIRIGDFNKDFNCWIGQRDNYNWYVINGDGAELVESKDEIIMLPQTGMLQITADDGQRLFDVNKNNIVFAHDYDHISALPENYYLISKDNRMGLMNDSGRIIAPMIYDEINGPFDGVFRVSSDLQDGLIDGNGNFLSPMSEKSWATMNEEFDTLITCREVWYDYNDFSLDLGNSKGKKNQPANCTIGKCKQANLQSAKNYLLAQFLGLDAWDEQVQLEDYFDEVYINDGNPEYDDDEIWEIYETFSIPAASRFSFTIKDLTTADEGSAEDNLNITNFLFMNNDWQEAGLADIFDMNKNLHALNDSIRARAEFRNENTDGNIEMVFDTISDTKILANYFFLTDKGMTLICVNRNEEAASEYIENNLTYSEFTWQELTPYLNKDFLKILRSR